MVSARRKFALVMGSAGEATGYLLVISYQTSTTSFPPDVRDEDFRMQNGFRDGSC